MVYDRNAWTPGPAAGLPDNAPGKIRHIDSGVVDASARLDTIEADYRTTTDTRTALRTFWTALAQRASTPVDILCIGDSITEGANAGSVNTRWTSAFRDALRTRFPVPGVAGGFGYVPARYYYAPTGAMVSNVSTVSTTNYGLGRRALGLNGAASTITLTFTGTAFDILYRTDPSLGTISYAVDGGAAVNVNTAAAAGVARTQVTGLTAGAHTVVLARVTGTSYINGFMTYNGDESAGGVRVWEGGHDAYTSADFVATGSPAAWVDDITFVQPDLVVIELGANDYCGPTGTTQPITASAFKTNIQALITNVRAKCTIPPSFVLAALYERNTGGLPGGSDPWSAYVTAMGEIAAADALVALFDAGTRLAPPGIVAAGGTIHADRIHPTTAGHVLLGDSLASFVAPQ
jgi:lysophospholipase L1-like esterase